MNLIFSNNLKLIYYFFKYKKFFLRILKIILIKLQEFQYQLRVQYAYFKF